MIGKKFKYIIIDGTYPMICSEANTHQELAAGRKVTSAGFARIDATANSGPDGDDADLDVDCWGESASLNIESKGADDAAIIRRLFCEMY